MYALGSLSAELIFTQAILNEIGLSFLLHVRADSSMARAMATKQGASQRMKHIHTRFLFVQDLVFRKLLNMSALKSDVNPNDIGTEGLNKLELCNRMIKTSNKINTSERNGDSEQDEERKETKSNQEIEGCNV